MYGSDEQQAFRDSFRRLIADCRGAPQVLDRAADAGFLGVQAPEEHGGCGLDGDTFVRTGIVELMRSGHTEAALAFANHAGVAIPVLLGSADPELRAQFMPGLATGEHRAAVACQPVQVQEADGKLWVTGSTTDVPAGLDATVFVVPVAGKPDKESLLVLDAATAHRSSSHGKQPAGAAADIHFDSVPVTPAQWLGLEAARRVTALRRLWTAVIAASGAAAVLDWTVEYVSERRVFGRPVAAFQNTRHQLARLGVDIDVATCALDMRMGELRGGTLATSSSAGVNLTCSELFDRAADIGLQLHGGYGYMREYPIAQAFTDARYLLLHGDGEAGLLDAVAADMPGPP